MWILVSLSMGDETVIQHMLKEVTLPDGSDSHLLEKLDYIFVNDLNLQLAPDFKLLGSLLLLIGNIGVTYKDHWIAIMQKTNFIDRIG